VQQSDLQFRSLSPWAQLVDQQCVGRGDHWLLMAARGHLEGMLDGHPGPADRVRIGSLLCLYQL
jgi:hypothetical protein